MKYVYVLQVILAVVFFSGCEQNRSTDDPEKLKTVLLNYFDGIKNKDFNKMLESTTDDFLLYEDGRIWNNDSVFMNIKRNVPFSVEYKFDNFKINVDNMSGDMTYYNNAEFVFNDTIKLSFNCIESATFRKNAGVWRMNFLHLTERK
jgi:hypothetical protein